MQKKGARDLLTTRPSANVDQMKDILLDIIIHDLASPINVINGIIELMELEQPHNHAVRMLRNNCNSIMELINQVRTLAEIRDGKTIHLQPLSMAQLISEIQDDYESVLAELNMTVEQHVDTGLYIEANPIIKEIFRNYIDNAIKYASYGQKIVIKVYQQDDSAIVSVTDFGTPLSKEQCENIFERGIRYRDKFQFGTGVGLSIAKIIAQAHRGEVWVEPNQSQGNTFYCRLPAVKKSSGENNPIECITTQAN